MLTQYVLRDCGRVTKLLLFQRDDKGKARGKEEKGRVNCLPEVERNVNIRVRKLATGERQRGPKGDRNLIFHL